MIIGFSCRQVSYLHHLDILARYYWGQGLGEEKSHLGISGAFPRHRPSTAAKNGAAAKFMTLMHALFVEVRREVNETGIERYLLKRGILEPFEAFSCQGKMYVKEETFLTMMGLRTK